MELIEYTKVSKRWSRAIAAVFIKNQYGRLALSNTFHKTLPIPIQGASLTLGVNLTLEKGQIIGIVGASGCRNYIQHSLWVFKADGGSVDIEFAKGGDIRPSVGYLLRVQRYLTVLCQIILIRRKTISRK